MELWPWPGSVPGSTSVFTFIGVSKDSASPQGLIQPGVLTGHWGSPLKMPLPDSTPPTPPQLPQVRALAVHGAGRGRNI